MWGALAAIVKGVLSLLLALVSRPAGAVDADDHEDQQEINDEIDTEIGIGIVIAVNEHEGEGIGAIA